MNRIGLGVVVVALWSQAAGAQFSQQGVKLVGGDAVGIALQGTSVTVSGDGNTAIIGGYLDNGSAGAAWVFTRSGGEWTQQGSKLVGTGASGNAAQGWSVALSGDGNTAIVGGPGDNGGAGAAWVFSRSGGVWTQQGSKFVGTGTTGNAAQGWSVALSSDGNTALVGGPGDNTDVGAAWVFTRSSGVWKQQGTKLVGTGAVGLAWQGWSVALSADGATAVIGGLHDNSDAGAVWVFTQSGGKWTQQGSKLVGSSLATAFTISGNASVAANFTQQLACDTFSVGASPSKGGSVAVNTPKNCNGGYLQGTEMSLTATPTSGWVFMGWSGSGGSFSSALTLTTTFTISGNASVTATFVENPPCYSLSTTASPTSGGSVTVNTSQTCSTGYTPGTQVSLTATSASGWTFVGWNGTGGSFSNASTPTTSFTITGAASVTASFTQEPACVPLSVTANPSDGGSVAVGTVQTCTDGYLQGTGIVLTATPASGWRFVGWSGSGGSFSTASLPTTTFTITASATVTAGFTQAPPPCYTLSAVANPSNGGSVTVTTPQNCSGGYTSGTVISLEANPTSGWTFVGWSGSGGSFSNIHGAVTNTLQGTSLAISGDGNTVVVGGVITAYAARTVWVFSRSGGTWTQQGGPLATTGEAGLSQQAWSVAISGDGNTAVVAEPGDNAGSGGGWVFSRSGETWAQQGNKLVGAGATGKAGQGFSAALSADGNTVVLGGPNDAGGAGAAWVFVNGGSAPACTFSLSPASQGFAARGGSGTIDVTVVSGSNCPWIAVSNSPWIAVGTGETGTDNGQVRYSVSSNLGVARSGTLTIGGQTFTVYQAGTNCAYALSPTSGSFPASGGSGSFGVTTTEDCPWTASSTVPWLHVSSGATGIGNGTVSFAVDANAASGRSGTIAVANQSFTVSQASFIPPVQASFTFAPSSPVVGQSVQFTDTSTSSPTSWSWSFGDGAASSAQNPTHGYTAAGSYTVTLTAANGSSSSSASQQLVVGPSLQASFTFAPSSPVVGQVVQFTDTSTSSPTSWSWSFGDGAASSAQNPTHGYTAAGSYTVTLTAANGSSSSSASQQLVVGPSLQSSFTFAPSSPVVGQSVQFTDTTTLSPTSWSWSFGDGGVSTEQNPTHSFAAAGAYTVTLTAANGITSNTASHEITVGPGFIAWVPVASHAGGTNGSVWRSDLAVIVPGAATANVQVLLYTSDGVMTSTTDVAAGSQVILTDVVALLGYDGSVALEVRSDQPVVVTSRTYDQLVNGTVGQDYASYGLASCLQTGQSAWLPQLTEDAAYRTNISLTNTGDAAAAVTVALYDGAGTLLTSYDVTLAPGEWKQENRPFFTKAKTTSMDRGYAQVSVTSGSGIIASASVIDNVTNDPTTVAMTVGPSATGSNSIWVPVVSHKAGANSSLWRSDLGVLVPGAVAANVQVLLYTPSGVLTTTTNVLAASQAILTDVVGQLGFEGSGALEVRSDQPAVVTSRTYNQSANGTVGQDYPSYATAATLGTGQSAWLPQLTENAAYRSNISITNTGTAAATATVTLYDGAGNVLTSYDEALGPGEWKQKNQPFFWLAGQTGLDSGFARVTVTSGSGIIVSASVIDNTTNDPTTIAMVQ